MDSPEKTELLRQKEIVEWQITIARDRDTIEKKENRLKKINKQLLKQT